MVVRSSFAFILILVLAVGVIALYDHQPVDASYPLVPTPSITLSSSSALPNQSIAVIGDDFTTGGYASVTNIKLDGRQLPTSKINSGRLVPVDSGGNFVAPIVIPLDSTTLLGGSLVIQVTDSEGVVATTNLNIPGRVLSLSSATTRPGIRVVVIGTNFPMRTSRYGGDAVETIVVTYQIGTRSPKRMTTASADSAGRFSASFEIPLDVPIPSLYNEVRAYIGGTNADAVAEHSVPAASIEISPISGPPGTRIVLSGSNFRAFSTFRSLKIGFAGVQPLSTISTDVDGKFAASFEVPDMGYGPKQVLVKFNDVTAAAPFTVEQRRVEADPLDQMADNLVRAFHFDVDANDWSFYDADPAFAPFTNIDHLEGGKTFWIQLQTDQTIFVASKDIELLQGWNLVSW